MLGPDVLAPAGTQARLIVDRRPTKAGAAPELALEIEKFKITGGPLPVAPRPVVVQAVEQGQDIPAVTLAIVERMGSRVQVRIPLPVPLGSEIPTAEFTPLAAQTPRVNATPNRYGRGTPPPRDTTPTPYTAPT